jgi:hypothetical protein
MDANQNEELTPLRGLGSPIPNESEKPEQKQSGNFWHQR